MIEDIKDMEPNQHTIEMLERMLEEKVFHYRAERRIVTGMPQIQSKLARERAPSHAEGQLVQMLETVRDHLITEEAVQKDAHAALLCRFPGQAMQMKIGGNVGLLL